MQKHGEQKRANGDPYFSHPLEVAAILTDMQLDEATIAVALLHDTIEDTDATREEIDTIFGEEIGGLVEGLTKMKRLDLVSKKAEQAENLRKLLLAISEDVRVLLVKLADRLHNMRTLDHMPEEKRKRIAEETMEIYAPLAGRMGMQDMREELEELAFRHINPQAHAHRHRRAWPRSGRTQQRLVMRISNELTQKLEREGIKATVRSRQKKALSVFRKMERKADRLRAALRHLRLPRHRREGRGLLPRARHRPHDLADGAGPFQGLHLDAEAERLPLDPHHHDRPVEPAHRTADPHLADAQHRRIRHRRAHALQGQGARPTAAIGENTAYGRLRRTIEQLAEG